MILRTKRWFKIAKGGKYKAIFFDFWGTVVENGIFPSPVRQVQRIFRIRLPFNEYIVRFEKVFMLNKYDNLYNAFKDVAKEFDLHPPEFVFDKLVGMWNKNTLLAKLYPETEQVLTELKKKYKLVLLVNTDCFSVVQLIEKFKLNDYFDEIVLSYEVGHLKTDPDMFNRAMKKIKVKKVEQVLMVGDSLETDVKGAETAGIKAILVDRRDRREYENKILDLNGLKDFL